MDGPGADVVIVGAGPAGASAAISCAGFGLRVLVVARPGSVGDRAGETLHPGVAPIFAQLGLAQRVDRAGFVRHLGIRVAWDEPDTPETDRVVPYGRDSHGPWYGYQAPAAEVDALLLDRARELGARVWATAAVRPVVRTDRVVGVETARGTVSAPFVIDAAGGGGWLARHLRLPRVRRSPMLLARFGYRDGDCPGHACAPLLRAEGPGWTWIARIGPSRYAWTRMLISGERVRHDWVPDELRALAPCGPTRSADVTWRALSQAAGPGWLAVGDAAAVLDPASSHGVLRALMSGIAAGHTVREALTEPDRETAVLAGYAAWIRDWFEHDATELRTLYARHPEVPAWVIGKSAVLP